MFSILIGILASVLPNLLFVWLYKKSLALAPDKFLKILYISEGLKFAGLALLLSICLQWSGLQVKHFILAFVGAEIMRAFYGVYLFARKIAK